MALTRYVSLFKNSLLSPYFALNFHQIPFPAITICPESKVDIEKFNFSKVLDALYNNKTVSKEDAKRYEALSQVCELKFENPVETPCNIIKTLREVASDFSNKSIARVARLETSFDDEFAEIVTRNGICYTSNMLDERDLFTKELVPHLRLPKGQYRSTWTSYGYDNSDPLTYPDRVLGSGKEAEFKISLRMKASDIDYTCRSTANGFRMTIHAPNELPQTDSDFYRIPFNVETLIVIEPRVTTTSDDLKNYKPKKRQCYFPGEKRLTYFKAYTQTNCKLECFIGERNFKGFTFFSCFFLVQLPF